MKGIDFMLDNSIDGHEDGELVRKMLEELKGEMKMVRTPRVSTGRKRLLLTGLEGQRELEG